MSAVLERRQFRRADLEAPVTIRPLGKEGPSAEAITGEVKNVSLAGVLCYVKGSCSLKPGDLVVCSMSVPSEQAPLFPFSHVLGKGWVVRVEPITPGRRAGENPTEEEVLGLAVAFAPDVTALGTIEY